MSRSINLGILLSCFQDLLNDEHDKVAFIKHVANRNPRLILSFYKRDAESVKRVDELDRRLDELMNVSRELSDERCKRHDAERYLANARRELEALKNPVRNPVSDATNEARKDVFERVALEHDQTFGTIPDAKVQVSFVLHAQDKKIHTIKWCRENTGYGLAEAKGWVENLTCNVYRCSYAKAVELRESFRKFAAMNGYTGVLYIKGE